MKKPEGSFAKRTLRLAQVMMMAASTAAAGSITREVWTGVLGTAVSAIPLATTPSTSGTLTSLEAPTNAGDNYGQRLRGYITAPATGSYTFWIASDDAGELWLSTDDQPANLVLLAAVSGNTGVREWAKYASQKSAAVALVEGVDYYVEVLHKEGTGGDNLAVGWAKPGEGVTAPSEVVPGSVLSPLGSNRLRVSNIMEAADLTVSAATLTGSLAVASDTNTTHVTVFWGPTDGGTTAGNWTGGTNTWPAPQRAGVPLAHVASGFATNTAYYFRFYAADAATNDWADASAVWITAPVTLSAINDASEAGLLPGLFRVARPSSVADAPLVVNYTVSGGDAIAGQNYVALSGSVTILAGQTSADVVVTPLPDWDTQTDRSLQLTLAAGGYLMGTPSSGAILIANQSPANGEWVSAASSATAYTWTDAANWLGGTVAGGPDSTADVALDVTGSSTLTINLRHNAVIGSLDMKDTGTGTDRPIAIRNATDETYGLTFDVSSGDATLSSEGAGNTIGAPIVLNDNLSLANTSTLYLSGGVSGNGGIAKNGAGQVSLYPGVNTFTGGFTLNAGTVYGEANTINVFGTGRLTLNGGTIRHGQSNGSALSNKITVGGSFSMNNYVISFNAGDAADAFVLNAANPTVTITASTGTRQHAFNGLISDGPAGGSGWTLECTTTTGTDGVLKLLSTASNTYTGKTRVPSGQMRLEKSGAATAIPGDLDIGGHATRGALVLLNGTSLNQIANTSTVTVLNNGTLNLNNRNETIGALVLATGCLVATGTGAGGTLTATTLTVDGKMKAAGTYTAANLGTFVTGNGSVVVLNGPPPGTCILLF